MANQSYNDIRPWCKEHPPEHVQAVVATDQVVLVCFTCGFSCTVDAVDAGLPVKHQPRKILVEVDADENVEVAS